MFPDEPGSILAISDFRLEVSRRSQTCRERLALRHCGVDHDSGDRLIDGVVREVPAYAVEAGVEVVEVSAWIAIGTGATAACPTGATRASGAIDGTTDASTRDRPERAGVCPATASMQCERFDTRIGRVSRACIRPSSRLPR